MPSLPPSRQPQFLPELLWCITLLLPIDKSLRNLATTSKCLLQASPILNSLSFARAHLAANLIHCSFDAFVLANNLDVFDNWRLLPSTYKTVLFAEAFRRDAFMLLHWWNISSTFAFRMCVSLISEVDGFSVSSGGSSILKWATSKEYWNVIRLLLLCGRVPSPSSFSNSSLRTSNHSTESICKHLQISPSVLQALAKQPQIDPNVSCNHAMRIACMHGHADIVVSLLSFESVNPGAWDNVALFLAAMHGHTDIISILLDLGEFNKEVDPSACENRALLAAIRGRHVDTANRLLLDPRVLKERELQRRQPWWVGVSWWPGATLQLLLLTGLSAVTLLSSVA
ncbi:hypothetical protein HDU78_006583 [Chytriomyces hyalinus]|nr:hypothetical protein HDU78_006583 [Chytriomyces hyalinus]